MGKKRGMPGGCYAQKFVPGYSWRVFSIFEIQWEENEAYFINKLDNYMCLYLQEASEDLLNQIKYCKEQANVFVHAKIKQNESPQPKGKGKGL